MKKLWSMLLVIAMLCGMCVVPVGAYEYNYKEDYKTMYPEYDGMYEYLRAMNEAFEYGYENIYDGDSLKGYAYDKNSNQYAAEMLGSVWWDIKPNDDELERLRSKYLLEYNHRVYDKELLREIIEFKFNISLYDIINIAKQKSEYSDYDVREIDDYFVIKSFGRGEMWPGCKLYVDKFEKLSENTVYAVWRYENPHDNFTEYSDTYYAILEKGIVAGKEIVGYRYLGTTPPSEELLARYKQKEITVTLNGKKIQFDQPPIIKDDRTLVPMRAIFEAMDCDVYWNEENQAVNVSKDNSDIMLLWIGEYEMWTQNGWVELDVPPQVVNDRTLVPVRAISETLNCDVDWDNDTQTVIISNDLFNSNEVCDSSLQYNNLEYFIKNEFENTELTAQGEPYSDIDTDTNYVTAYHEIKDYTFIDIDKDGCDELIVSSEARQESYPKQSFSIWDCDESGNVFCVLNKFGQTSRAAYRYFISEYDGNIYVLESTGEGNSVGHTSYRNLYTYDGENLNPEIKLFAHISFDLSFDDQESFTVDGIESERDYVCNYINDLDTNSIFLYEQFGYMQ